MGDAEGCVSIHAVDDDEGEAPPRTTRLARHPDVHSFSITGMTFRDLAVGDGNDDNSRLIAVSSSADKTLAFVDVALRGAGDRGSSARIFVVVLILLLAIAAAAVVARLFLSTT